MLGIYAGAQLIVYPPAGIHMPATVYEQWFRREEEKGRAMGQLFHAATEGEVFDAEWRYLPSGGHTVVDAVMPLARCCDMVVAGLYNPDTGEYAFDGVAETLAMESGRPVLLVPEGYEPRSGLFDQIMVAWDGSRESARATFDALPLLVDAAAV